MDEHSDAHEALGNSGRTWLPPFWTLVLGWAILTFLFGAALVSGLLGAQGTVVLDDYACVVAPAVAGLACWYRSRRVARESRRAWRLLACALFAWSAGAVVWAIYEVHLGREVPFPSLADVGYLLFAPLAAAGVVSLPSVRVEGFGRLRALLDGFVMSGALLYISWATLLGPAVSASGSGSAVLLAMAYPVTDVIIVTVALLALARARGEQRITMSLIALGLLTVAGTDSLYAWLITQGTYATASVVDAGWFGGFLLIGLAALRPCAGSAPVAEDAVPAGYALWLPYVPLMAGIAMTVGLHLTGTPMGKDLFYVGLIVIIAVLGRQLLSLRVNSSLARRLHDTVGTLRLREVELEYLAFHDPLTGLANRALFADRVSHALSRTRLPHPVIVLLADLDDFKSVNDTLGHPAGDALLVAVADRLRSVVRPEDTVARLGGDEFAILLEDADGVVGAEDVATRISEALAQPLHLSGVLGTVRASIGIAAAGQSATQESLLRDADIAMYSAKAAGKGRYAFYAEALAAASVGRALLKSDLSGALARGELALKYQPIIAVASGHVTGVEALLRWHHPYQGEVLPAIFIPLAEETDAILPIGRWVITEACRQAGRWRHNLPEDAPSIQLAVNLSARQLGDPELIPTLTDALAAAGLPPASLTLEITESAMPADDDANMATVLALHSLGVKLAIDDFGTGQSSLSRLRHFPVDSLKVDRSFISELSLEAPAPDVLISAILAVGLGLGMNVIAEGVETHEQLEVLRALNCPEAQGYLFSRPAEPDVIEALIHTGIALSDPLDTRL